MGFLTAFWSVLVELSVWLFVGAVVSVFMYKYLPENFIRGKLQGYNGVFRSVLLGVPLPLCSCGVIPAGISLKKNGASSGSAVGFLISTPQTGVDSILVSSAFLGWPFALFKVFAAVVMGVLGGSLVEVLEDPTEEEQFHAKTEKKSKTWKDAFEHGIQLIRGIWKWLIVGIALSAILDVWVPDELLMALGSGFVASLTALAISVPLYVCATASVPIAASLVAGGFPPAAALVFLVAGPATNVATIGAILSTFGKRTTVIYVGTVVLGSLILGSLFSFVVPVTQVSSTHMHHAWWMELSAVALVGMLLYFAYEEFIQMQQLRHLKKIQGDADLEDVDRNTGHAKVHQLQLQGIHCGSCVAKITKELNHRFSLNEVSVDKESEMLHFTGQVDLGDVTSTIRELGFGVYETKTLEVEGLHCGSCVSKLTQALQKTSGVDSAFVLLDERTATVNSMLLERELENVIEEAGFSIVQKSS